MATLKEGMEGINKASTARTTSDFASDDYIQLFRTNGNEMAADYKISKSVLMDCIQSALGTLLNGGTAQTTGITKVPSLVGNALGATTIANLASVLGDVVKTLDTETDPNTLTDSGWYDIVTIEGGTYSANLPYTATSKSRGIMFIPPKWAGGKTTQIIYRPFQGEIYIRATSSPSSTANWTSWYKIAGVEVS